MRNVLFIAAPALALIASPAAAERTVNIDGEFSIEIAHDDLDLTTSKGVSRLETRIRNRVRHMCDTTKNDVASIRAERECRESTTKSAEAQVRFAVAQANLSKVRLASQETVEPEA